MKAWLYVVAGVSASFLGGVFVGRWSQPVKVVQVTKTVEVAGKTVVQTVEKQSAEHDTGAVRKVIRWIPQPQKCGDAAPPPPPVVEQVEESVTDHQEASAERAKGAEQDYHLLAKDERKLEVRPQSQWHALGVVGVDAMHLNVVRSGLVLTHDIGPGEVGVFGMYSPGSVTLGIAAGLHWQ